MLETRSFLAAGWPCRLCHTHHQYRYFIIRMRKSINDPATQNDIVLKSTAIHGIALRLGARDGVYDEQIDR
jgi:hypothetical protein